MTWLHAHLALIGWLLGAYALVAGLVNKTFWQKPLPNDKRWKIALHWLLIDWPGLLPSRGMTSFWGMSFSIPFLTWSQVLAGPPKLNSVVKLAPLVLFALSQESCAWLQKEGTLFARAAIKCNAPTDGISIYNDGRQAIHDGGAAWIAPILEGASLVGCMVRDELASHSCAGDDCTPAQGVNANELARADTALRIVEAKNPDELRALMLKAVALRNP
jgi:hypothetical protein